MQNKILYTVCAAADYPGKLIKLLSGEMVYNN